MSINNLMDHKCNIHHIIKTSSGGGFGLPAEDKYSYSKDPDILSQPCHFKLNKLIITDSGPAKSFSSTSHADFPIGTDVRPNDKIVDLETNIVYYCNIPKNLRGNRIRCDLRTEPYNV